MTLEEWEQWAQLGRYRPATDDWPAIENASKEQGAVMVWGNSCQVYDFCRTGTGKRMDGQGQRYGREGVCE